MGIKKSVMLSDQTVAAINARSKEFCEAVEGEKPDIRWSFAVNNAFDKLQWIIQQSLPELTESEWREIINVYAGSWLNEFVIPYRIASDMMDNAGACSLDDLSPDYAALVKKVHGLSQVEQMAIIEVVQQFWCGGEKWNKYDRLTQIIEAIVYPKI